MLVEKSTLIVISCRFIYLNPSPIRYTNSSNFPDCMTRRAKNSSRKSCHLDNSLLSHPAANEFGNMQRTIKRFCEIFPAPCQSGEALEWRDWFSVISAIAFANCLSQINHDKRLIDLCKKRQTKSSRELSFLWHLVQRFSLSLPIFHFFFKCAAARGREGKTAPSNKRKRRKKKEFHRVAAEAQAVFLRERAAEPRLWFLSFFPFVVASRCLQFTFDA